MYSVADTLTRLCILRIRQCGGGEQARTIIVARGACPTRHRDVGGRVGGDERDREKCESPRLSKAVRQLVSLRRSPAGISSQPFHPSGERERERDNELQGPHRYQASSADRLPIATSLVAFTFFSRVAGHGQPVRRGHLRPATASAALERPSAKQRHHQRQPAGAAPSETGELKWDTA